MCCYLCVMAKTTKRPKDIMQLAKHIGDIATGEIVDTISPKKKKEAAAKSVKANGQKTK